MAKKCKKVSVTTLDTSPSVEGAKNVVLKTDNTNSITPNANAKINKGRV